MNPLQQLSQVEQEADDFGFSWPDANTILEQIISECGEIQQALHQDQAAARVQEEIGDLIHAACSLCWFSGFDITTTTQQATDKFAVRLSRVKALAKHDGFTTLQGQPFDVLMDYWNRAKS